MSKLMRMRLVVSLCLVVIGIGFAILPDTWIESWFGFEPDGGNGWVEGLLAAIPLGLGVTLGAEVFYRYRRPHRVNSIEPSFLQRH